MKTKGSRNLNERKVNRCKKHCNRCKKRKVSGRGGKTLRSLEDTKRLKRKENVRGRKSEVAEAKIPRGTRCNIVRKTRRNKGRSKRGREPPCCAHLLTHTQTPHFRRHVSQKRGGGRGAGELVHLTPLPLLSRFLLYFARNRAVILPLPNSSPRRPGGGGLPLPAAASAAP